MGAIVVPETNNRGAPPASTFLFSITTNSINSDRLSHHLALLLTRPALTALVCPIAYVTFDPTPSIIIRIWNQRLTGEDDGSQHEFSLQLFTSTAPRICNNRKSIIKSSQTASAAEQQNKIHNRIFQESWGNHNEPAQRIPEIKPAKKKKKRASNKTKRERERERERKHGETNRMIDTIEAESKWRSANFRLHLALLID